MFRRCFTSQCVLATVIIGGIVMADSSADALAKAKIIAAKGDSAGAETVYWQIIKDSSDSALVIPAHGNLQFCAFKAVGLVKRNR